MADDAEAGDLGSKRFALLRVSQASPQNVLRSTHGERSQFQTPNVENVERDHMPAAGFTQQVLYRDFDIVEEDGGGGTALDAHLLLFRAGRDAGKGAFHQKSRELVAVDLGEDGEEVGAAAVGDPHLLTIQHVVSSVGGKVGAGLGGQSVGARLGL